MLRLCESFSKRYAADAQLDYLNYKSDGERASNGSQLLTAENIADDTRVALCIYCGVLSIIYERARWEISSYILYVSEYNGIDTSHIEFIWN